MTGMSHAALAASVGRFIPNPFVAFVAGVASHLTIDKVPHFWPNTKRNQLILIITDAIVSLGFIFFLTTIPLPNKNSVIAASLGGISVDFVFVILAQFIKPLYDSKPRVWHEKRQIHSSNPWYFYTDILVTALFLLVLFLW